MWTVTSKHGSGGGDGEDGGDGGADGGGSGGEGGASDTKKVTSLEGLASLMVSRMISTPCCEMATYALASQPLRR